MRKEPWSLKFVMLTLGEHQGSFSTGLTKPQPHQKSRQPTKTLASVQPNLTKPRPQKTKKR
jgi:hypothetical protein